MWRKFFFLSGLILLAVGCAGIGGEPPEPTAEATPSSTIEVTPSDTPETPEEVTPEPTVEATEAPTVTPTDTAESPGAPVAILVIDDFGPLSGDEEPPPDLPEDAVCTITADGLGKFGGGRAPLPTPPKPQGVLPTSPETAGLLRTMNVRHGQLVHHTLRGSMSDLQGVLPASPETVNLLWSMGIRHGQLVYSKLQELISVDYGLPQSTIDGSTISPDLRDVTIWVDGQERPILLLIGVDTAGFDTSTLASRIEEAMAVTEAEWDAQRLVLNMSFGLIPCYYPELSPDEYREMIGDDEMGLSPLQPLLQDLDALVAENYIDGETASLVLTARARTLLYHNQGIAEGIQVVYDQTTREQADELFNSLQAWSPPLDAEGVETAAADEAVIAVAAAGNSDLPFPFAPAMWPGVVAVGAEPDYANDSEVLMGDKVEVKDSAGNSVVVEGTSFAAPELSYLMAVLLLNGGSAECAGASGATRPPLSYADAPGGSWDNLDLATARTEHCNTFP